MGNDVYRYGNDGGLCKLLHLEGGLMEKTEEKKPVVAILRDMELNEKVSFLLEQKSYIQTVIWGRLEKEKREGKSWSVETKREENAIVVTRTA